MTGKRPAWPYRLWARVHEPRVIAVLQAMIYTIYLGGALTVFHTPPQTVEGVIGSASMTVLAAMLAISSLIGIPCALFGWKWMEQRISAGVIMSALIYGWIIISLQFSGAGNRFLQLAFVTGAVIHQIARLFRLTGTPYDRELTVTNPV